MVYNYAELSSDKLEYVPVADLEELPEDVDGGVDERFDVADGHGL